VIVSDREILDAQRELSSTAGLFAEPAAAASFAGFLKVRERLDRDLRAVVLLTGNGLKDVDAALKLFVH
jgi:threonine synthase